MPVNHSKYLEMYQNLDIVLAELLLVSASPSTEFLVEQIEIDFGFLYPGMKYTARTHGGVVMVQADSRLDNGCLEVHYYRTPAAYEMDMDAFGNQRRPFLNPDMEKIRFTNLFSPEFGNESNERAASSILNFFLCGGDLPKPGAYRKN